ncbi:Discoidin-1 subunit A [Holothuria leucospilota]|uniref:Discoidin-1 subunit A n=1 Tax=Holothuria leucospilota TaxID=206669 RepID=A0A9Q1BGW2_HOLLE|nr:Discoidin-1 subunit A [Holothuria leucospilota]
MAAFLLLCLLFLVQDRTDAADGSPYCSYKAQPGTCCQRFRLIVNRDSHVCLKASSSYNSKHGPNRAALFETDNYGQPSGGIGGWAAKTNNANQWIQVGFDSSRRVTGVLLQGRGGPTTGDQWVTSFRVLFSDDEKVFYSTPVIEGTFDRDTVAHRYFDHPITARYFRINPVTWHGHITLRFDLLGCDV